MALSGTRGVSRSYYPNLAPKSHITPAKCTLSNGAPCLACTRQKKLTAQIEETKKLLDKLIADEHQARIDINNYHDPCHRLPVEIISHIFSLTLPEFALQSKVRNWPSSEKVPSKPWVLRLGAVSQRWRKIAWSTPRLWSTIMLSLYKEPTDNQVSVFGEWLERSDPLPLSIRLYLSENSSSTLRNPYDDDETASGSYVDDDDIESSNVEGLLSLLSEQSERWKDLSLQCHQRVFNNLNQFLEYGAPCLQTLQIIPRCCRGEEEKSWGPEFSLDGPKPQPDRVIALGYSRLRQIDVSWNNVTKVTVEDLELAECICLLLNSPNLMNVRLQNIGRASRSDLLKHIPQVPRTLPRIQTLYMSSSTFSEAPFSTIFDSTTLPSLKELSINGPDSEGGRCIRFTPTSLLAFLDRSSCALTSFTLARSIGFDDSEIIDLLYRLPHSVEKLELDIQRPGIDSEDVNLFVLFNHLSRAMIATNGIRSRPELLPNLVDFQYRVFAKSQVPWNVLPRLLRPFSGKPRPLKKIKIIGRDSHMHKGARSPLIAALKDKKLDESTVRDLSKMMEDGVELFGPHKVSSKELLAFLQK